MNTDIFKALAVCLTACAFCIVLRRQSAEYAFFLAVTAGIGIILLVLKRVSVPLSQLKSEFDKYGLNGEYFKTALKAVGIGYITSFTSELCRDSGQGSLASAAELVGKGAIFVLSVPLMLSILEAAVGFLK